MAFIKCRNETVGEISSIIGDIVPSWGFSGFVLLMGLEGVSF
jgi:hypothetical protein